jgi:cyanate permease
MILAELIFCLAAIACFVVGALRWKTDWWVLGGLLLACAVAVMIFAGLLSLFK